MTFSPVLVACAHGTRDERGRAAIDALVASIASAPGAPEVVAAYVDVQGPTPEEALAALGGRPAVLVPLLLSTGYHVSVDLARAVRSGPPGRVAVAPALGPDWALVGVLVARLRAAGVASAEVAAPGVGRAARGGYGGDDAEEPIRLVAAGSSRERSAADVEATARDLAVAMRRPVAPAYLSASDPLIDDVVTADRASGRRTIAASYLLAPGFFTDRLLASGADPVTAPLLDPEQEAPPALVDLVLRRFAEAKAQLA